MPTLLSRPLHLVAAAVALVLATPPAGATTIVPLSDRSLVAQSPVIVTARVEGTTTPDVSRPVTDWLVSVESVHKGEVAGSGLVVRVLGGETPEGGQLRIFGAPQFSAGERVLLFLAPHPDGTYRIQQFVQGAFHVVSLGSRAAAVQDLSEVRVVDARGRTRRSGGKVRDFDRFVKWIQAEVDQRPAPRDYMFRPGRRQQQAIVSRFTLFENAGFNLRWFQFDNGGSVTWRSHQGGQPGLASGGFAEHQRALAAWNAESRTPVHLVYGGTSTATTGLSSDDGLNVLLFGDPNHEIEGTFDCATGGTLAIGGPWFSARDRGTFNGKTFIRIAEGDIVMNDGIECSFAGSCSASKFMEEVYAHETGHTLGLGHSSEAPSESNSTLREALMYYRAHDDCRGGRLNSDDTAGLQYLYRKSTGGGGGGGGGGGNGSCPPGTLCFLSGRFEATLTWENQFNPGETGVGKPIPYSDLAGFFYFGQDPRNIEMVVKIVDFGGRILVFYSELTTIRFRLRITDKSTGQTKEYTNSAGDCGALDPDFVGQPGTANLTSGGPPASIRDLGVTEPAGIACRPAPDTLCLLGNRFKVKLPTWTNQFDGSTGAGTAKSFNDLTGAFHFSQDPRNLEIFFKMNQFPDRFLVYYGSVAVFDYTLRLTDTMTGRTTEFRNPAGRYCGGFVNNLLAGPPF